MESLAIRSLATGGPAPTDPSASNDDGTFAATLKDVVSKANQEQLSAEAETRALVAGEGDIVDTMIAVGRAEVSMRFVVSLRNRALEAYQEVMRIQV